MDRLPLPKCSYINTDFPGDDLLFATDDEPGINSGSARACKARCKQEEACSFWSYREGSNRDTFTRDCFLKEGTPGNTCIITWSYLQTGQCNFHSNKTLLENYFFAADFLFRKRSLLISKSVQSIILSLLNIIVDLNNQDIYHL